MSDFDTSRQDTFLYKLHRCVLENLENEQFDVEELSRQMGMSRSNLHRKVKKLHQKSISQYIRDIRLNEAVKLLLKDVGTVSEVAYRVGFNSPTYFHRCFQSRYGFSPSEAPEKYASGKLLIDQEPVLAPTTLPEVSKQEPTSGKWSPHALIGKNKWAKASAFAVIALAIMIILYQLVNPGKEDRTVSLAVLPLQNLTGDTDQQYFVRGLHESLISSLGQVSSLRVISRTSTLAYKNKEKILQDIAQELHVDVIMEGSVSGSADQMQVQLRLIDALPTEKQIWNNSYEEELQDILFLQRDIVQQVTRTIGVELTEQEAQIMQEYTRQVDPDAYKAYLRGMFHWEKLTDEDLNTSMRYFELSRELDPDFALAYSGIASVWMGRLQQGLISYDEAWSKMKAALIRSQSIVKSDNIADFHQMNGALACWADYQYEVSESEYKKAIAINPNSSLARAYLSHVLLILHKEEEAMEQLEIAREIDPFNPLVMALYGMALNFTRQYDKAKTLMETTLERAPNNVIALSTLRTTYHLTGEYDKALHIWERSFDVRDDREAQQIAAEGRKNGAYGQTLRTLAELLIRRSEQEYVTPFQIATLYTRAGASMEAVEWLVKAYESHDPNMPYLEVDPIFDILTDLDSYQNLLFKMNLVNTR